MGFLFDLFAGSLLGCAVSVSFVTKAMAMWRSIQKIRLVLKDLSSLIIGRSSRLM